MPAVAQFGSCVESLYNALKSGDARSVELCRALLRNHHTQLLAGGKDMLARWRAALTRRQAQAAQDPVAQAVLLLIAVLIEMSNEKSDADYASLKLDIEVVDPDIGYWYQRWDGGAATGPAPSHQFFGEGQYLELTMPEPLQAPPEYCNAEIYNSPSTTILPKNVVLSPFPVDTPNTPHELDNFLADIFLNQPYVAANGLVFEARIKAGGIANGSRGWGFWNTSMLLGSMRLAWFAQYDGEVSEGGERETGLYVETLNGLSYDRKQVREDFDEDWHDYRIELNADRVDYFLDGRHVHTVKNKDTIPAEPMALHCWVDNAVYAIGPDGMEHREQPWTGPRTVTIASMAILSLPALAIGLPAYYTSTPVLPMSGSPQQLSNWLSTNPTSYNEAAWCFYGHLIRDDGAVDGLLFLTQYQDSNVAGREWPTVVAGLCYNPARLGGAEPGYMGTGTGGLPGLPALPAAPSQPFLPSVTMVSSPWAVSAQYPDDEYSRDGKKPSAFSCRLIEGEVGRPGAVYEIAADALFAAPSAPDTKDRLSLVVRMRDRYGVIAAGYGPSSFLPQWLSNRQQSLIAQGEFAGSVGDYLEKTGDPMTYQGAYYLSAPLLEVTEFQIRDRNGLVATGQGGCFWIDWVVQSFDRSALASVSMAGWTYFAIQFPSVGWSMMISEVTVQDPTSRFFVAKLFTDKSRTTANGARIASREWRQQEIHIRPNDAYPPWHSRLGKPYALHYVVTLDSPEGESHLFIDTVRDDQEITVDDSSKYEGVFRVRANVSGTELEGWAWGELH